jgi:poly-gamma-glutamate synthesis protein (capsule biosynthesis protein)
MRYHLFIYLLFTLFACRATNELPPLDVPIQLPRVAEPTQGLATPTLILQPQPTSKSAAAAAPTLTPIVESTSQSALRVSSYLPLRRAGDFAWVDGDADITIGVAGTTRVGQWVFAVVVPFYSVRDAISLAEVQAAWESGQVVVSADILPFLNPRWGATSLIVESTRDRLWAGDAAVGIVPFHQLTADLKVLSVDGQTPRDRTLDLATYPLAVPLMATGDSRALTAFQDSLTEPITNWQPEKMTTLAMTGVTALVRATAYNMEQYGILWPGEEVGEVLRSADFAHISNEVAFLDDCPYPSFIGGTSFCSDTRYLELLEEIGTDIIELTGNHVNDYGSDGFADDFDLYKARGMQTFGGGVNSADAAQPLLLTHNGNRIALVGCNEIGPTYAWATATTAGARPCDGSLPAQIAQLRSDGYAVIVTLQYHEHYFYEPTYQQTQDFRAYADAGAVVVSGSQGHHAQAFDLYGESFIHYGLGNLFFDQMDDLGTRQTFIDQYLFYEGRLLGVELWTGLIEDYARPRLMTEGERQQLLQTIFNVSLRE